MNKLPSGTSDSKPKMSSRSMIVIALAAIVGGLIGSQGVSSFFKPNLKGLQPPEFQASAWAKRTIEDISIETPFNFGPGPKVEHQLPEFIKNSIVYFHLYQGLRTPASFTVMAARIAYKPQIVANLDGAVNGAILEVAAKVGDDNPDYSSTNIVISGLEARRVTYECEMSGQKVFINGVFACKDEKLWQVQVIYMNKSSEKEASRILESVAITP